MSDAHSSYNVQTQLIPIIIANVKIILWSADVLVYQPSAALWFSSWTRTHQRPKEVNWNFLTYKAKIRHWQQSWLFIDFCLLANNKTVMRVSGSLPHFLSDSTPEVCRYRPDIRRWTFICPSRWCLYFLIQAQDKCSSNLLILLWLINGVGGFAWLKQSAFIMILMTA